jgi:hypothetical protein
LTLYDSGSSTGEERKSHSDAERRAATRNLTRAFDSKRSPVADHLAHTKADVADAEASALIAIAARSCVANEFVAESSETVRLELIRSGSLEKHRERWRECDEWWLVVRAFLPAVGNSERALYGEMAVDMG